MNKSRNWPLVGVVIIALAILIAAGWAARQAAEISEFVTAGVDHTREVDLALERLLGALSDAESAQRGYLLVADDKFLETYEGALPRVKAETDRIALLTLDNTVQQRRVPQLRSLIEQRLAILDRGIQSRRQSQAAALALISAGNGKALMDSIRSLVAAMQETEQGLLASRQTAAARANQVSRNGSIAVSVLACVLVVLLVFLTDRGAKRLRQSERRLATTLSSIGDAVIATDAEGRVERMNTVAERLTGWSLAEARGRPLEDVFVIVNEETLVRVENPVTKVLREGGTVGLANQTRLLSRDGGGLAIEDSAAPIGEEPHGADGIVLVFRDATKTREQERVREASEQRFRQIADSMPQMVYVTDAQGEADYVNRRWHEYTGQNNFSLSEDEESIHAGDRAALIAAWQIAVSTQTPLEAVFRLRNLSGEWRWFLTRAEPLADPIDQQMRWYGTSTDIHDKIMAQEALAQADRRKDEYVAMLAHELRNPLSPITNAIHILKAAPHKESSRDWAISVIDRQVRVMSALLDDLLDVARITHGTLTLNKQPVSLRSIFDGALETAGPLIEARHHTLTVEIEPPDVMVEADPLRLTQVMVNLLTNAAKYTEPGGRICLQGGEQGDQVWVEVRDSGMGLDAIALSYVFNLFAQVPSAKTDAQGGLGVGLALAKGLVDLHEGTITAMSAGLGQGSQFLVTLPGGGIVPDGRRQLEVEGA